MWEAWQLAVPAIGLTCLDHCHPGSKVARPTGPPARLTSSSFPELSANGRTSSGLSKFILISLAIGILLFVRLRDVRRRNSQRSKGIATERQRRSRRRCPRERTHLIHHAPLPWHRHRSATRVRSSARVTGKRPCEHTTLTQQAR